MGIKSSGAFKDSNGKAFYGIASASEIKNYSLQRIAADDRARNEISKIFKIYIKALTKDYMEHNTAGDLSRSSEEQKIQVVMKVVTANTLTGVQIIGHWEHPGKNVMFSLARLDLESFKKNLSRYKEFSKEAREAIKERADAIHDELEQEVLKKEGKS